MAKSNSTAAAWRDLLLIAAIAAAVVLSAAGSHHGVRSEAAPFSALATTNGPTGSTASMLPRTSPECPCPRPHAPDLSVSAATTPRASHTPTHATNAEALVERFFGDSGGRREQAIVADPTDGRAYLLRTANLLHVRGWIAVQDSDEP